MMRDRVLLILFAVAFAVGAWAFWHYLDQDALATLSILALVSVTADNLRLRRKLRDMDSSP